MLHSIQEKIKIYESLNDVHQHKLILEASESFLSAYPSGTTNKEELEVGLQLIRHLSRLNYLGSMREYENNYALQNEVLSKKIRIFKHCIPESHAELRGLTELLIGLKENALG